MLYSSIDIETTGKEPGVNQLIQIALIKDDLSKELSSNPEQFMCYVAHDSYNIDPYLIANNHTFHTLDILEKISKVQQKKIFKQTGLFKDENGDLFVHYKNLGSVLYNFFQECDWPQNENGEFKIIAGGKNVNAFDIPFIKSTIEDVDQLFIFSHRVLDPSILFLNPITDKEIPNLTLCKERAGFTDSTVSHDAFSDAMDIVKLIRKHFNGIL